MLIDFKSDDEKEVFKSGISEICKIHLGEQTTPQNREMIKNELIAYIRNFTGMTFNIIIEESKDGYFTYNIKPFET